MHAELAKLICSAAANQASAVGWYLALFVTPLGTRSLTWLLKRRKEVGPLEEKTGKVDPPRSKLPCSRDQKLDLDGSGCEQTNAAHPQCQLRLD